MLVFTRKSGEQIMVPSCDVTIEVLRIAGSRVRLGVKAPRNTAVHRAEILRRSSLSVEPEAGKADSQAAPAIRVLVADPDPCLANSYRRFLAGRGFRSGVANNALDCVNRLRTEVPDVLVLDPDLLWGGGEGVLALIREDYTVPLVPTLIHTWNKGPATFYDGVFPVVQQTAKPLGLTQMEEEIRAMMERFGPRPSLAASGRLNAELAESLQQWIARRSAGRVRSLDVETCDGRVVVRGVSETYYGRQLVQAAVMEALNELGVGRPEEVEIDIVVTAKPR
jgi:carbon storage regulator